MDWGLAKVLSDRPLNLGGLSAIDTGPDTEIKAMRDTDGATQTGSVLGTPAYMPREQAIGMIDKIDRRSDVFGLGAILCTILTGKPPYVGDTFEATRQLAALAKLDDAFVRLDSCGEAPDYIALCKKCLAPDQDDRPRDAGEVARAVTALRTSAEQRARDAELERAKAEVHAAEQRKRRKVQLVLSTAAMVILLAGITGTAIGFFREADQRKIAERNERNALGAAEEERLAKLREAAQLAIAIEQRAKAEKARDRTRDVLDAMTSEVTGDSLATQKAITEEQKKFLKDVLVYYREFAGEKPDDERSRKRTAVAAHKVGLIEYRLGHLEEAATAFRLARDGFAALAAAFPAVAYRRELAGNHNNLGLLLDVLGKRAEAEVEYRQALAIREKLAADFPAVPAYRQLLAQSHNNLGLLLEVLGKRAEAEAETRQALAIQEKLATEFPAVPEYRHELALSHHDLGNLLAVLGKRAEAESEYRQVLAIREKLAADFPAVPEYRQGLARLHNSLGGLLADLGKRSEAEAEFRKALAIQEKRAAEFPAVPEYRQDLAGSHNNLGRLLAGLEKRAEAEVELQKALAIQEELVADFPAVPAYRHDLAQSHNNLGLLLKDLGKRAGAEAETRQALAIQEKLAADFPAVPEYRQELAGSHYNMGNLLAGLGKRAEAEAEYRKALAIQEKLAADFPAVTTYRHDLASSHKNLGHLLAGLGKRADAGGEYRKALAIREKLAADFPAVLAYQVELGGSYYDYGRNEGKPAESLEWFDLAIRTLKPVHDREPRDVTAKQSLRNSHWGRAAAYHQLNKPAEAVKDWDRVIELSPPAERLGLRASRATSRLEAGMVAEAVSEVAELTKSASWNAGEWYNFACLYAVASGKEADKKQEYADRAMELLHKAVKAGFTDAPRMAKDKDFDPLRDRADFKKLLAELAKKE